MGADGPEGIAEITLTPCISRKEEKERNVVKGMTGGNSPVLEPDHKKAFRLTTSIPSHRNTFLKENSNHISVKLKFFLAVRHRVKYALRTSEAPPRTHGFACIKFLFSA